MAGYVREGSEWVVLLAREKRTVALAYLKEKPTVDVTVLGPATGAKSGIRVWVPHAEIETVMTPRDLGFRDDDAVTEAILDVWQTRQSPKQPFVFTVSVWELDPEAERLRLTTFPQIEQFLQESKLDIIGPHKAKLVGGRPGNADRVSFLMQVGDPTRGIVLAAEAAAGQVKGTATGQLFDVVVSRRGGGARELSVRRIPKVMPPDTTNYRITTKGGKTKCSLKRPLTVADRNALRAMSEDLDYRQVIDELYEQSNRLFAETKATADAAVGMAKPDRELLARAVEVNAYGVRLEVIDPRTTSGESSLRLWLKKDECGGDPEKLFAVGDDVVVRSLDNPINEGQLDVSMRPLPDSLVVGTVIRTNTGGVGFRLAGSRNGFCWWREMSLRPQSTTPAVGDRFPAVVLKPSEKEDRDVPLSHWKAACFALECAGCPLVGTVEKVEGQFVSVRLTPFLVGSIHITEFGTKWLDPAELASLAPIGSAVTVRILKLNDKGQLELSRKAAYRSELNSRQGQKLAGKVYVIDGDKFIIELAPAIIGVCHSSVYSGPRKEGETCVVVYAEWNDKQKPPIKLAGKFSPTEPSTPLTVRGGRNADEIIHEFSDAIEAISAPLRDSTRDLSAARDALAKFCASGPGQKSCTIIGSRVRWRRTVALAAEGGLCADASLAP